MFACGGLGHNTFTVKSTPDQQSLLIQHPAIEKAAYVGRFGWVTITVTDEATLELTQDLIDESYDQISPKQKKPSLKKR
jgi:predicted DNA-binding protein (MmcQ/YjbR family)